MKTFLVGYTWKSNQNFRRSVTQEAESVEDALSYVRYRVCASQDDQRDLEFLFVIREGML